MTFSEYIEYWRQGAISNKGIHHLSDPNYKAFARMNIEEVLTGLKSNFKNRAMVLENPEIRPYDSLSDNSRKMISGGVLFVEECKIGDFDDEMAKLDALQIIGEQFMAKIVNDVRKFKQDKNHPHKIKGIDQNSMALNKIGPLWGNWHGWRLTFTLNQDFNTGLRLNNDDWKNDTAFSIND